MSSDEQSIILTPAGEIRIRRATSAEIIGLRHEILRAGLPRETAVFEGDDHPDACHVLAAALQGGGVVGCATVYPSMWNGAPAWQLRGMATHPAVRQTGVGRAMLSFLENILLRESAVRQAWCNARVTAVGFYQRLGWRIASEPFEIPSAGPHVQMTKWLTG